MVKVSYMSYSHDQITQAYPFSVIKQFILAVRSAKYIHSRTRFWCRHNVTTIYHKDSASPSGKIAIIGGPDVLIAEILRRQRKTSPLSPTEML